MEEAPHGIDMLDTQFKLHDKFSIFKRNEEPRSSINLLTASSSRGLLFAGNPSAAELKVIITKGIIEAKNVNRKLQARTVQLPGVPISIACSADGNLLAVNYTQNESALMQIYTVPSFTTPNINPIYTIRLSPESNVYALQLLWNPVLPNSIAVVLNHGAFGVYTLKEGGNFEFHSLDKSQQVKCACWSPKGKQIVLGFPDGKLQQFKPDLTPAKTIACPPNVLSPPFDTIALHWLSTYQFAVVYLQHAHEMSPSLYIVNAPKGGAQRYINYYDICYSMNGPRAHQFTFTHISQWNLLLVISANGVEVGVLGTTESGDTPNWLQYTLVDEARIELPLSEIQEETFPAGFAYDTSSTHQLVVREQKLPAMPMVHVLSTDGLLISFDFLNLKPGAIDVCSPPPPLADISGQFLPIDTIDAVKENQVTGIPGITPLADVSFGFASVNAITSTPALKDKPTSLFAPLTNTISNANNNAALLLGQPPSMSAFGLNTTSANKPSIGFGLGAANTALSASPFGAIGGISASPANNAFSGFSSLATSKTTTSLSGFGVKLAESAPNLTIAPTSVATMIGAVPQSQQQQHHQQQQQHHHQQQQHHHQQQQQQHQQTNQIKSVDLNKPLYTVPSTFTVCSTSATNVMGKTIPGAQAKSTTANNANNNNVNSFEVEDVVNQIIVVQINAFNQEIQQIKQQSSTLLENIGNTDEVKKYTTRLYDLQEIEDQAHDCDFELDVQNLRQTLNDAYTIIAECRSKLETHKNPDITRLMVHNNFDPISRRQLKHLQSYLTSNDAKLRHVQNEVDNQWDRYQDLLRRKSKTKMHIPCLDGIYQRMSKIKNLLSEQRLKLNHAKTLMRDKCLLVHKTLHEGDTVRYSSDTNIESLAESILSLSLSQTIDTKCPKMSADKLKILRTLTQQNRIKIIKAQRPHRVGINSEVILETKIKRNTKTRDRQTATVADVTTTTTIAASSADKVQFTTPAVIGASTTAPAVEAKVKSEPLIPKPAVGKSLLTTPTFGSIPSIAPTNLSFGGALIPAPATVASEVTNSSFGVSTASSSFEKSVKTTASMAATVLAPTPIAPLKADIVPFTTFGNVMAANSAFSGQTSAKPSTFATTTQPSSSSFGLAQTPNASTTATITAAAVAAPSVTSFINNNKPLVGGSLTKDAPVSFNVSFSGANANSATAIKPIFVSSSDSSFSFSGFGSTLNSPSSGSTSAVSASLTKPSFINDSITSSLSSISTGVVVPKPNFFEGFGKTTTEGATTTVAPATTPAEPALNVPKSLETFNLFSSQSKSIVSTSSTGATTTPFTGTSVSSITPIANVDTTDTLFGNINICKPTVKDDGGDVAKSNTGNFFSGLGVASGGKSTFSFSNGGAGDASKGFFANTNNSLTMGTATSVAISNSAGGTTSVTVSTPATVVVVAPAITTATTATSSLTSTTSMLSTTTTTTTASSPSASSASSFSFMAALGGLNVTAVPTSASTVTSAMPTSFSSSGSIPSTSSSFTAFGSTTTTATSSSSMGFGVTASSNTSGSSIFSAAVAANPAPPPAAATGPFFGTAAVAANSAAAPTGGSIFGGGLPKPEQSVFGSAAAVAPSPTQPPTGLFAAAAAANPLPFPSPTGTTNTNIFGGGSIFGGGAATNSPFGSNSFYGGGANTIKPVSDGSIFAPGGAFGQSTSSNAVSGANVFGMVSGAQTAATGGFGASGGGSIFGGGGNAQTTGGSIFGGGSAFGPSAGGNAFGAFSQPAPGGSVFGSPSGTFAQGGASVSQTGFGSPQAQQQQMQGSSAFAKPVFGGAATFGSPKGFGSFAAPAAISPTGSAFSTPQQKNSLFETLGASDAGLSFGNLAQTGQTNAPKPAFGGSSFMNYRN